MVTYVTTYTWKLLFDVKAIQLNNVAAPALIVSMRTLAM